jgi:demethylmenaquinone methyltransferase/2-methoxy-6-polyprenyl-1,4-benzoquinol methylase
MAQGTNDGPVPDDPHDASPPVTSPLPPSPEVPEERPGLAERRRGVASLFADAARDYNCVGGSLDLGSGRWYRGYALRRAGLGPGMTLLDVATGTGLLARAGARIVRTSGAVVGVDANAAMLREARQALPGTLVQGWAESLPFRSDRFDVLSVGFLLRYVDDLEAIFGECHRVLRPGGRLLILELSRPESRGARWLVRTHFQRVLPWIVGLRTRSEPAQRLTRYCWDSIDRGVPPTAVLDLLRRSGFADVRRHVWFGLFGEYFATKPAVTPGPTHCPAGPPGPSSRP